MSKERSYTNGAGRLLFLRSNLDVSKAGNWTVELWLYEKRFFGRKLIDHRTSTKSGTWSTTAIGLLRAQEELTMLQTAGVELDITGIKP